MSTPLVIVSVGAVPVDDVMALFTEHICEQQITYIDLYKQYHRETAQTVDTVQQGANLLLTDRQKIPPSQVKHMLRATVKALDDGTHDVIMVLGHGLFPEVITHNAMLLIPDRIVPPLVTPIVDGHQVGILLSSLDLLASHRQKWTVLDKPPLYAEVSLSGPDAALVCAGERLKKEGAEVLLLDCPGFYQRHRDFLQSALAIPVLLSHVLLARLASELLL